MKPRGIALEILYRIGKGVEDIGSVEKLPGGFCRTLHEIVIVGIYTRYHVAAGLAEQAVDGRAFASAEQGAAAVVLRREHNLEIDAVCLIRTEHCAPEENVVVALNVCHDAAAGVTRTKGVGGGQIVGRYVTGEFHRQNWAATARGERM